MLSFPGIFRGLLDMKAKGVNEEIKFAARAIAHTIYDHDLHDDYSIPSLFDRNVVSAVSHAVADAAQKKGFT